jgi:hypothetical protein
VLQSLTYQAHPDGEVSDWAWRVALHTRLDSDGGLDHKYHVTTESVALVPRTAPRKPREAVLMGPPTE